MKAVTYQGMKRIKVKEVPDANIQKADDVLVRITTTAICGSDLHIYNGEVPNMPENFVIGHEPMGFVEEVGPEVTHKVEIFNVGETDDLVEHLKEITGGGADVVIDCVGLDSEKTIAEKIQTMLKLQGGGLGAFRMAVNLVRKGGTIQVTGVYGMNYNLFPFGDLFRRNINLRMGQAPVIHYARAVPTN